MLSDFLLTIFNADNKIIIGDKVIYLDHEGSLIDFNTKNIFGTVTNSLDGDIDSRAYNVNFTKSWVRTVGARRVYVRIFNETIYINGNISSSRVFYKIDQERESCSFWRCTWKTHERTATINPNFIWSIPCSLQWTVQSNVNQIFSFHAVSTTRLIATYNTSSPCTIAPFHILNNSSLSYNSEFNHNFTGLDYSFDPL